MTPTGLRTSPASVPGADGHPGVPGAGNVEPPPHFDICGPLPGPGVTLLEASAGTGKTFTIAALVTRMVAEDVVPLSEVLVVTFTRMATGELRERVRQSLSNVEAALRLVEVGLAGDVQMVDGQQVGASGPLDQGTLAGGPGMGALVQLLASGSPQDVRARRQRLSDAVANFDAATLTTTHGFCHAVLEALGTRGEVAPGAQLMEDTSDLLAEVVDDLYLRHALRGSPPPFRRDHALQAAAQAVANPGTALGPPPDPTDSSAGGLLRRLAARARQEVDDRLREGNLLTYDGLLARLARTLSRPGRGQAACERLRQHYRVVLVDEFQDTDQVQWEVVRNAFAGGSTRLVLIGDPKQAIYAFRGADVYAYLEASHAAGPTQRFTLDRNWRSDDGLLHAYNALFMPLQLGHAEILYRPALATPAHAKPGLEGAPDPAPLRARVVDRKAPWVPKTARGMVQKAAGSQLVADDLACDVARLLNAKTKVVQWSEDGQRLHERVVTPGDIGVLVRTNRQAALVQSALRACGVPAAVAGAESVLSTPAASAWLSLLAALEQPSDRALAVAVALGPFVGLGAREVALADESVWELLHEQLHGWALVGRQAGIASLFSSVSVSQHLPQRLLGQLEGERLLTDLGHVAEVLHGQSLKAQMGLSALRTWLARRTSDRTVEGDDAEQRSRRLDSGADAVQLLTVHRAKGLEFPIVYCPFLWDGAKPERLGCPVVFHDPQDGNRRKLDVGGDPDDVLYRRHFAQHQQEARGEDLRHLYVALTRARHQTVIWWAGAKDSQHSALGRLLLRRRSDGEVAPEGSGAPPQDHLVTEALAEVAGRAKGLVNVEKVGPVQSQRWSPDGDDRAPGRLATASFTRLLDQHWRRNSFTSITASAHEAWGAALVSSEPEVVSVTDERGQKAALVGNVAGVGRDEAPSPWAQVPSGAELGTLAHKVLEKVDFASSRLGADLEELVMAERSRHPGSLASIDALAAGLHKAIEAPLGPLAGGARLADLRRRDRRDEMSFELPVAGGDAARGEATLEAVARLWRLHMPAGSVLAGYAEHLEGPGLVPVWRGFLTGSLDLVARLRSGDGDERYFVVDYKTNWLSSPDGALDLSRYSPASLELEMQRAHYPLQALLYLVALHRYLRWRLPAYEPERHLAGSLYLFLRGMGGTGPAGPDDAAAPSGVLSWAAPPGLVVAVSDLLGKGV